MKGQAALAILIVVICNVVGIFTIPLYLEWLIYSNANVQFDIGKMMLKLFISLFIPLAVSFFFCLLLKCTNSNDLLITGARVDIICSRFECV